MKLGETLVHDGRITDLVLQDSIVRQQEEGGKLGSILVEMGAIDVETLTVYLGLEFGIPIATGATMERCKRSAVRLLTPEQAARLKAVPIVIQGQTLLAAMDNPYDLWTLDELTSITGYRVIPRVIPEIRLFYYLERFYGVRRPPRWAALGESPRGNRNLTLEMMNLPAPPLPGLPPRLAKKKSGNASPTVSRLETSQPAPEPEPIAPPLEPFDDDERTVVEPSPMADAYEAIEIDAADLVIELEADDAETASPAPESEALAAIERARPAVGRSEYAPLSLEQALDKMKGGAQRGAIGDAVLGYASDKFAAAVLCLVRDGMAFGWKGLGDTVEPSRVEALLIPLEAPSMFQTARHSDGLFVGQPFPAALHSYLYKVLRCSAPKNACVAVIKIGSRPVNMLYAHKKDGSALIGTEVDALRDLMTAAGEAYVRLITVRKMPPRPAATSDEATDEATP